MLPRYHILFGAIFALIFWSLAKISIIDTLLILLSSVLIDFDHYIVSAVKTKKLSLFHAFDYHNRRAAEYLRSHSNGKRNKGDFHLFHTIEFHLLIAIAGIFFAPFFFIFIGMIFHSALDIFAMVKEDNLYLREFFFSKWLRNKMLVLI